MKMEPQPLFEIDPAIFEEKDKYIYLGASKTERKEALRIFEEMVALGIYCRGFVSEEKRLVGASIFRKPIIDMETYRQKEGALISMWGKQPKTQKFVMINGSYDRGKVVVYGAGDHAEQVIPILKSICKEIMIVDNDKNKQGRSIEGLEIQKPESIMSNDIDIIVEAARNYQSIDRDVDKYRMDADRLYANPQKETFLQIQGENVSVSLMIRQLCLALRDKELYIWCDDEKAFSKLCDIYKMLDIPVCGRLTSEGVCDGSIPKFPVCEILYHENAFIVIEPGKFKEGIQILESLGLEYGKDFQVVWPFIDDRQYRRCEILDMNLGYSYIGESKYPGFTVSGNEETAKYRIVVLGGSTTDGAIFAFSSWVDHFYREFAGERAVVVYNGGVAGYTSTQELLKLLRDVLVLDPDMVILYNGFNDAFIGNENPFAFGYLSVIFQYALKNIESGNYFATGSAHAEYLGGVCICKDKEKSRFEQYLQTLDLMYAIAKSQGIRLLAFSQPCLCTKKRRSREEEALWITTANYYMDKSCHALTQFREKIGQAQETRDWLYDLTRIFDGIANVYRDECHLWEKGNEMIGNAIAEIVKSKFLKSGMPD